MNKYSSKAIKTAATVGMSLAMVLSNAAPVLAASTQTVCKLSESYQSGDYIESAKHEIVGVITTAEAKQKVADAINNKPKSIEKTIEGQKIVNYLGYQEDNGGVKAVNGTITTSDLNGSKVTYGYYSEKDYVIPVSNSYEVIKIDKNSPLEGETVEESITGRNADAVKTDMNEYVKEQTKNQGFSGFTGSPVTFTKTIKNDKGAESNVTLTVTYKIDEKTEVTDGTDPSTDLNSAKKVVMQVKTGSAFNNYECTDIQIGEGLNIGDRYTAKNVYNEIVAAFEKASLSFDSIKAGDEVTFTQPNTASLKTMTILTNANMPQLDIDFKAVLKELARYLDNTTDEGKAVERLYGIDTAMSDMFKADGYLNQAKKYNEDTKFKTNAEYTAAADLLEKFNKFETYLTNLSDSKYDEVTEAKSTLEDLVNNYVAENNGDLLDKYLTTLDKFYEKFIDANGTNGITKAAVDTAIKQIKNGTTFTDVKGKQETLEKADYTAFKENSGVEEYMTKFEDMYAEIEAVKEAVAKTNQAYKDLIKGDSSVKKFLTDKTKDFSAIKSTIKLDDYKILKAYKEDVLDVVLTLEAKQVGNNYVNKSEKSIYATKAQLDAVMKNIGTETDFTRAVLTTLDKEKGEFNWDKLVAHMEKVEASLEAVTTGIEKLDSISLTVNDRAAILAADDAIYFLTDSGAKNLTSAQTRTVKNADRKVAELMEAYRMKFGSLNAELNGWVNKGDGNWAYYENGNAVTKWVASGSDWYYVKGGVMLRNSWIASDAQGSKWYYVDDAGKMVSNTTINGYTFNSYGVWVK